MIKGGDDFVKERNIEFLVKVEYALHIFCDRTGFEKRVSVMCGRTRGDS